MQQRHLRSRTPETKERCFSLDRPKSATLRVQWQEASYIRLAWMGVSSSRLSGFKLQQGLEV